jgi:hypothetical protein
MLPALQVCGTAVQAARHQPNSEPHTHRLVMMGLKSATAVIAEGDILQRENSEKIGKEETQQGLPVFLGSRSGVSTSLRADCKPCKPGVST